MKLKMNKSLLLVILCQAIILLFALGNFVLCKMNLKEIIFDPTQLECSQELIVDNYLAVSVSNSAAGVVVSTPELELSKGSYVVHINYHTNGEDNSLSAYSPTLAPHHLKTNEVSLVPEERAVALKMDVGRRTDDIVLRLRYQGTGFIEITGLALYQTTDSAKETLVYALMLCMLISFVYYVCTAKLENRRIAFGLAVIAVTASYPLFLDYLLVGHDLPFHLLRIEAIKTGLDQGVFPVKIHPYLANDYGYATGVFYGDILLYFPAILRKMGFSVQMAYQCFVFVVNIATTVISYFCFKKLFNSEKSGMLGSMLYTLSMYRLLNVYTRAAVGEYCAMIFLPMIFVGLYQIYALKDAKGWWKWCILPALGLTGVIQSHILSCEMVAVFILLTCIILCKRTFKPHIFVALAGTVVLTLLINAGFLVPFLDYYFTEEFIINSDQWSTASVQTMGLFLAQMFAAFPKANGGTWSTAAGMTSEFDPALGLPLIFGFLLYIYCLFTTDKEDRKRHQFKLTVLTFCYGVAAMVLSTYFFPYDSLAESGELGRALVSSLQFPWRFLSLATLFLTVSTCYAMKYGMKQLLTGEGRTESAKAWSGTIGAIMIGLITMISCAWYYNDFASEETPYRVYETYELSSMQLYSCEYLPAGTDLDEITRGRYEYSDGITIEDIRKTGTSLSCWVKNAGGDGYMEVPLTLYKGYEAIYVEGEKELEITAGYNNAIRVEIPADFLGTVEIAFKEPVYWRIAEVISLLTIISLIGYGILEWKKYSKNRE